jgi:ABC-type sugar transport system substrate-binding protein
MRSQSLRRRSCARTGLAGLTVVASFALAACGAGEDSDRGSAESSSGGGDEVATAEANVAEYTDAVSSYPEIPEISGDVAALEGKNVWYVPIGAAAPILTAFGTGMEEALREAGINLQTCDGKFVPTAIAACLDQAATQGADAVVTGYVDYELIPTAFDNLVANDIPVLIAGAAPSGGKTSSPELAFYDTTESIQLTQSLMMDAVIADSGGTANILYATITDSPQLIAAGEYGEQYLTDQCPGCTITTVEYNSASVSRLPSQISSGLIANPDINYVVGEVDAAVEPSIAGIQSAGFADKVRVVATNGDLGGLQRIQSGNFQFVDVGTSPIYGGWAFADGILRMLTGETPEVLPGLIRVFNEDNVGDLTLTPEAYATIDWYGAPNYQDNFLSAWGLS